ncbi:uncharacterized protein LOC134854938 [Symsagittifera roscoffensis]|uniref:uncharacterized protein LOC134854938 n=1 Tax=Symsagittifera roscoffensis TaxID=84072 RepID=UPI00307B571F
MSEYADAFCPDFAVHVPTVYDYEGNISSAFGFKMVDEPENEMVDVCVMDRNHIIRYTCQSSLALTSISDDLYRIINANVKETVPELDLEESDENYIKDRDFHRKSLVQKLTKTSLSIDYTDEKQKYYADEKQNQTQKSIQLENYSSELVQNAENHQENAAGQQPKVNGIHDKFILLSELYKIFRC